MTATGLGPKRKLSDEEVLSLAQTGGFDIYGRFVVNELHARKSPLLDQNADVFLSHEESRLTVLAALGRMDEVAGKSETISHDDVGRVIAARRRLGGDTRSLLAALNKQTEAFSVRVSLAKHMQELDLDGQWTLSAPAHELQNRKARTDVRLIGITKLKDEGPLAHELLRHMLEFCDQVVVSDGSVPPIQEDLAQDVASRIVVIPQDQPFNEEKLYGSLWAAARELGGTHLLHMDADERLADAVKPDELRAFVVRLEPGEALAVPWPQILQADGLKQISFDAFAPFSFGRLLPPYKDLVVADAGDLPIRPLRLHCPWPPDGLPRKRFFADDMPLLHLEGLDLPFWVRKYNRYYHWDFALNGNLSGVLRRYLPLCFRNLRLSEDDAAPYLTPWKDQIPAVYSEELARRGRTPSAAPEPIDTRAAKLFDLFAFKVR